MTRFLTSNIVGTEVISSDSINAVLESIYTENMNYEIWATVN